ncbi:MAG: VanW family protein [Chloroflexales bacterium]|nr:VanW family protein [Chloroflexales bacterium]
MPPRYAQKYGPIQRRRNGFTPPSSPMSQSTPVRETRVVGGGITGWLTRTYDHASSNDIRGVVIIAVVLVLLAVFVPYLLPNSEPTVSTGVTLQGVRMSGLTRNMLTERISKRYETFLNEPVTLVYGDKIWHPSAPDLGISIDIRQTSNELLGMSTGRGLGILFHTTWLRWQGILDVGPHVVVNAAKLQNYLVQITKEIDQPVQGSDIVIDGQTGAVQAIPAQMGHQLLVEQTMVEILNTIRTAQPLTVTVRTNVLAPSTDDKTLALSVNNAKQFLSAPIAIRYGKQNWVWQRDDLIRFIATNKTARGIEVIPDVHAIATEVDRMAQYIDTGSVEARVTVGDGRATIVQPSRHGVRLDRAAAVQKISDAFFKTDRVVELPTVEVLPQLSASQIAALRFGDVLSTGRSSFVGSAKYRITNIVAGAKHINGVLIAPGATFSFNTEVGEINEANGFVKGYAVVGKRTQLEWGGGVCQVSTSLFRAAFYAGMPFTEWHPHPFYIKWYDDYAYPDVAGPGLDAAIYTGELDLRFVNDTAHWVMIDTTVDTEKQILDITLRGTATDRAVRVVGPKITNTIPAPKDPVYVDDPTIATGITKQSDKAKDGISVVAYRIITVHGKDLPGEEFASNFAPWPNIFLRGTGPAIKP